MNTALTAALDALRRLFSPPSSWPPLPPVGDTSSNLARPFASSNDDTEADDSAHLWALEDRPSATADEADGWPIRYLEDEQAAADELIDYSTDQSHHLDLEHDR